MAKNTEPASAQDGPASVEAPDPVGQALDAMIGGLEAIRPALSGNDTGEGWGEFRSAMASAESALQRARNAARLIEEKRYVNVS